MKDWEAESDVVITFDDRGDECTMTLKQENIPGYDSYGKFVHTDSLLNGWKENIFEKMAKVFGYPIKVT